MTTPRWKRGTCPLPKAPFSDFCPHTLVFLLLILTSMASSLRTFSLVSGSLLDIVTPGSPRRGVGPWSLPCLTEQNCTAHQHHSLFICFPGIWLFPALCFVWTAAIIYLELMPRDRTAGSQRRQACELVRNCPRLSRGACGFLQLPPPGWPHRI